MQRIAQDWLVLELTGSVTAVGVAVALQFLPVLLFGLFGGVIADRYPKRRILMITQSVAATMALTLGLLALTHTVQAWHVFVVAAMLGFVTVVDNPTRQVFVSELVGTRHIRNAVSLNSSVFQFGALLGPGPVGPAHPRRRPGLVVHDQLRRLPAGGRHRRDHPGADSARPTRPVRAKGQLREGLQLHQGHLRGGLDHRAGRHDGRARAQHAGDLGGLRRSRVRHRRRWLQPVQLPHRHRRADRSDPVGSPDRRAAAAERW